MYWLPLVVMLTACASAPVPVDPAEYTIPVVKADGRVETYIVEPDPAGVERLLFCIESPNLVLCMAVNNGMAEKHYFPMGPPMAAEPQL